MPVPKQTQRVSDDSDDHRTASEPAPKNDIESRRLSRWGRGSFFIIIAISIVQLYWYVPAVPDQDSLVRLFFFTSTFSILALSGLYLFAYKFYEDSFFLYLSIGWFANSSNIFFEYLSLTNPSVRAEGLTFQIGVYIISFIQTLFFYVASYVPLSKAADYRRTKARTLVSELLLGLERRLKVPKPANYMMVILRSFLWILWVLAWLVGVDLLLPYISPDLSMNRKFVLMTAGGVPFAAWSLFRVGRALEFRLDPATHRSWSRMLPYTLYAYGLLQLLYLVKLDSKILISTAFGLAFIAKFLNGIGLFNVARLDYNDVQDRLIKRNVLEDVGVLTGNIEHNIRSPLAVISQEIQSLRDMIQSNPAAVNILDQIDRQRQRIFITSKLVGILREDKAFYQKLMQKTGMREVVSYCIKSVKDEVTTSEVNFNADDARLFVKAYRPLLEQAIINVLKNAVEAIRETPKKRGSIKISYKILPNAVETVRVDIADTGCGISEDDLRKLNDVLEHQTGQVTLFTTKKDKRLNSGVGLFISNKILRMHDGRIGIQSKVGEGTTVSLYLQRMR